MRNFFGFFWACLKLAWRGSLLAANNWAWLAGSLVVGATLAALGLQVIANGLLGGVIQTAAFVGAAWTVIFAARLLLAPSHLYAEAKARIQSLEAQLAAARRGPDCEYKLAVDGVQLIRDRNNVNVEYQVRVVIHNTSEHPIRFEVIDGGVTIDGVSPHFDKRRSDIAATIPGHAMRGLDFPGYPQGSISYRERMDGEMNVTIAYGVAGYDYSWVMSRSCLMFANFPEDANGTLPTVTRITRETDDPYVSPS